MLKKVIPNIVKRQGIPFFNCSKELTIKCYLVRGTAAVDKTFCETISSEEMCFLEKGKKKLWNLINVSCMKVSQIVNSITKSYSAWKKSLQPFADI